MNPKEFKMEDVKIGKQLGEGGFGNVFPIEYHGKKYAMKKISKDKVHNNKDLEEYMIKALEREKSILRKMSEYENSVKFYFDTEDNENYIFFMELCDESLNKLLAKKKKFTPSEILYIMEGLNQVFKYMVNNNIIHRDIKPDNILIKYIDDSKTKFIPKICDYGIARELENGVANTDVGTPEFKAPEVIDDEEYNNKSDLFSIGVMIHYLLFYEYPFEIIYHKYGNKVNYKKNKIKDCEDKNLNDLIKKLLICDPEKRISWEEYFNHPFFNSNKKVEDLNNKLNKLKINDNKEHKIINFYDFNLEKIICQNDAEREIIKNIDPTNFISIDDCLKSNDDSYYILGILGKYLKQIGISVHIEKDNFPINKVFRDYQKNIFQLICNNYILKNKYLLEFELGERRLNEFDDDPVQIGNFNGELNRIILEAYNLNEEELLVFNYRREKSKYTVAMIIKSNFKKSFTKDELIKIFEKENEEFSTLSKVEEELIIPIVKLSKSMLSPLNNNKRDEWGKGQRGGEDYNPPIGWINYAIKIKDCFVDKKWIGHSNSKGEWCVAYCGIKSKNIEQIYENDDDIRHPGKKVGTGVYCPSDPKIMEKDAETINVNGEDYKVGFMVRVKPDKIRASAKNKNIWIVNGNDNEFRPYGILIKDKNKKIK